MSNEGIDRRSLPPEWDELELVVRRLLDDYEQMRRSVARVNTRVTELEAAVNDISSGVVDPVEVSREAERLRERNRDLEARLAQARERVDRIAGRLEFAGEER